jgi:mannose-6-phosphate isomerase-like protein (cupin superfamily)
MFKLTTAASVLALAAALGAPTVRVQASTAQALPTQAAPEIPAKSAGPPAKSAATPATSAAKPAAQGTGRATATLFVTNPSGTPIPDVTITLTGPVDREVVTTREAATRIPNLRSGTYRVRFDAPDYVLFEKEFVLRSGQLWEFEVTLNPAPEKQVEAPPPPPPTPAKKPVAPPEPAGAVTMLSLSDWLDENLIGRNEPQRDSVISQAPGATATIFQVRENVTDRVHADADAMLYVIAGEATLRIGGRAQAVAASWFASIPRGTPYSIERRGRNPLIVLSILAPTRGAPLESR